MESNSSSSSDEELLLLAVASKVRRKRTKREWVHQTLKTRSRYGEFHGLIQEYLNSDDGRFKSHFRMDKKQFSILVNLLRNDVEKQHTKFREPISPEERVAVCLRFLSTGDSYKTIAASYRIGHSTVSSIVPEVCESIWKQLKPIVMPEPTTNIWRSIANEFENVWHFPNCIGAVDGKHVQIVCPKMSGSKFFNYKKTFSVVLMAVVDARYRFVLIDVGSFGKNSDSAIFSHSQMGQRFAENKMQVPQDSLLKGTRISIPYVLVGDEAFPLKTYLMRPYPGAQTKGNEEKQIFNYRLSRARRVVESAFGILAQRWRVYMRRIQVSPKNIDKIILATCCLHNFLISADPNADLFTNEGGPNSPDSEEVSILQQLRRRAGNSSSEAAEVREIFKTYFSSEAGGVSWQLDRIRQGLRKN